MNAIEFGHYAAIDAVNWSTLKELRRSPLHYRHRLTSPLEDKANLRAGRAAHTAVFEPDRFLLDYALFDHKNKGGKVVRNGNIWKEFRAANAHRTIITPAEYRRAITYRDAVRANKFAMVYLERGQAEKTITWRDPESGLNLKARLDFLSESSPAVVDLKGTGSIVYSRFAATAYKMGYHCQLGFYQWGVREALGLTVPVKVIAVEDGPPHDVGVMEYGEPELEAGLNEVRSLLVKLAYHRERDEWPGQYTEEQVLEFPTWATERDDENVSELGLED
jgi:hypothetical protein